MTSTVATTPADRPISKFSSTNGNPKLTIKAFIAGKQSSSASNLFLYRNRTGQWVYQTYSTETGLPSSPEMYFLMQGKPENDGRMIMPKVGEVATVLGYRFVGLQWDENLTAGQLEAELEKAFELLQENEANPQA